MIAEETVANCCERSLCVSFHP